MRCSTASWTLSALPIAARVEGRARGGDSEGATIVRVYLRGGSNALPSSLSSSTLDGAPSSITGTTSGRAPRQRLGCATIKIARAAPRAVNPPKKKRAKSTSSSATKITPGKIFVGGLKQSVSDTTLQQYFETYGAITEAVVMMDRVTGRSRGFGYVSFVDVKSVDEILMKSDHQIHSKWADIKRAVPRGGR
jgi:hypothetical protein